MNITDLIVEFLKEGNTVEIPGIGTLSNITVDAHHDTQSGTYYPARRTIGYSAEMSGNTDIVKRIAEKECVTPDIAAMMWRNYVDALQDKLQRSRSHTFNGLGSLELSGNAIKFNTIEGLDLDAGKRQDIPLENIATYVPKGNDPFAAFEQPIAQPAPQPAAEMPVQAAPAEPAPENTTAKEAEHANAAETAAAIAATTVAASEAKAVEDTVNDRLKKIEQLDAAQTLTEKEKAKAEKAAAEEAAKAAKEREKAEKRAAEEAEKKAKEQAKAEKRAAEEQAKEQAKAEKAAAERKALAEKEAAIARKEAEKEEKKAAKEAKKEAKRQAKDDKKALAKIDKSKLNENNRQKRKKRRRWFWIILVLILFLAAGGYYYKTRYYVPETIQTQTPAKHVETGYTNVFTYSLDMLQFDSAEVGQNCDRTMEFLSEYVSTFLGAHHYLNAKGIVMERIREQAEDRLTELMADGYAVQRFIPYSDFVRDFCLNELKGVRAYRNRVTVQTELMQLKYLNGLLDEVIAEYGLKPDGAGVARPQATPKPQEVKVEEPVYNVPTRNASKQGYDIIAGFFTNKTSASKLTYNLKNLGCDAYIINKSGLYYVSMGSAASQTAAESLFEHIKGWYKGDIVIKKW